MLCLVVQSCPTLGEPMNCSPPGSSVHGDSQGKHTGLGCHAPLHWIFPTQGLNPGLPHCRWILYLLSHQGSPRILEWVACPFSRGSSGPKNGTGVLLALLQADLYQLSSQGSPIESIQVSVVHICQPQSPNSSHAPLVPFGDHMVSSSVSLFLHCR